MANYYASARSNYFKVKDLEAFKAWVDTIPGIGLWADRPDGEVGIFVNDCDGAGWPSYRWNDELAPEPDDFDLAEELSEHLTDDSVAILMEVGNEKLRYLTGFAIAVNSKGEILRVSINDIYELVVKNWDLEVSLAEY